MNLGSCAYSIVLCQSAFHEDEGGPEGQGHRDDAVFVGKITPSGAFLTRR